MNDAIFNRSIRLQIEANQARTPTERMRAMLDLLATARKMVPPGPEAERRRRLFEREREKDREQFRQFLRRLRAASDGRGRPGV